MNFGESNTPDRSDSLAQQKTIEAPEAILTLGNMEDGQLKCFVLANYSGWQE